MPRSDWQQVFVDRERYYTVLIDTVTGEKFGVVTITEIAWRDITFRLTDEEYKWLTTDKPRFDSLMEDFAFDKGVRFFANRLVAE